MVSGTLRVSVPPLAFNITCAPSTVVALVAAVSTIVPLVVPWGSAGRLALTPAGKPLKLSVVPHAAP